MGEGGPEDPRSLRRAIPLTPSHNRFTIRQYSKYRKISVDLPQTVRALAALSHETRLALYRMLVERGPDGLPAGVIADRLGVPPSSLTFHVQHLHRAGLVTQRRVGRQLIYAADYAAMNGLIATLTENCCGRGTAQQCSVPAEPSHGIRKSA
jgi:ArsR family transcriptional regulator